jgi:hypothetical protein
MPTTVAAYVVVQDNELLVEAAAPQQTFPCFGAPDGDEDLPSVLVCRLRPFMGEDESIRVDLTLNNSPIGADFFFDTGKRGWTETIREGLLRPEGNELTVTLSSVDGSPAPVGSLIGVQEVSLFYSVTLP